MRDIYIIDQNWQQKITIDKNPIYIVELGYNRIGVGVEDNVVDFEAKSQKKKEFEVTDEEFQMFWDALTGPYKGGGITLE